MGNVLNTIKNKWRGLSHRFVVKYDRKQDMEICGCSLTEYVPSPFRDTMGATGSSATSYWSLEEVFANADFKETDSFIDVGCGKGRVLAFLLREKFPGKITGIELTEEVAEYCKKWAEKYENIEVINGNAFDINYNDYNILCMCRPFLPPQFKQFIEKLEAELTHPITFYYYVDQQSGGFIKNRPGWKMLERKILHKKNGYYLSVAPQGCSVWTYTPENCR
ncbi:MAG: class I SAM-dependent methyltransferase [Oscillospiraceae bacterium]|nr:class I SAM-dependent methyltransferase [Oscillospiraceae bacterium]